MLFQSASLFQSTLNLTIKWVKRHLIVFNVDFKKKSLTEDIKEKEYEWTLFNMPFTDLEKQ